MLKIEGKNIYFRYVQPQDVEFIYQLRTDPEISKYLSPVDGTIEGQRTWINEYKKREENKEEHYFIMELPHGASIGTIRMYDFRQGSFCWGSWIILPGAPPSCAIESVLMIYQYGFNYLGFHQSHFDVMKKNKHVVNFHVKFGAKIVSEDHEKFYFIMTPAQLRFQRIFNPINVYHSG